MAGAIWQLVDSSGIGGIERHVGILAQALNAEGHPCVVRLLADHGANPWLKQLDAAGVPYAVLDGGLPALLRRLRAERPRLLHTHGYKAGILGRLAARLVGIPCVSTFHAGERGRFPVSLYQWLDAQSARLASVIAVSEPIAAALPVPARVIGNFVPVPDQAPAPPASDVVAFVGRLSPEKGPDLFCALAAGFEGRLRFEMFGDGPMRAELERRYGDVVTFHGLVLDPAQIWPRIGLLALTSRAEGLPLAVVEAMAAGVPAAASRVGALPEVIADGVDGFLFPPGDVDAMTRTVAKWHALPATERARMSRAAWNVVRLRYGVAARLLEVLDVYRAALGLAALPPGAPATGAAGP